MASGQTWEEADQFSVLCLHTYKLPNEDYAPCAREKYSSEKDFIPVVAIPENTHSQKWTPEQAQTCSSLQDSWE